MALQSRPWRIRSDIWEKLDEICIKLDNKKSYNCTDKIIQSASELIMEDIDITDISIRNSILGIKYLISSNVFYNLISNIQDEKIYKEIANSLLSTITNKVQETFLLYLENFENNCKERSILENVIRGLTYILGENIKLVADGKTRFEIINASTNPNIINFLRIITEILDENFQIIELDHSCKNDRICIKLDFC
ncbi:conserved hypothetical protein [Sulfolobus islandicus Y.G.57.14]|jgi:hypothetical protein|uniref:Uncharacterized protein n=6 Tax=Saccharolobus islandicus TaxID=43080 RepID=C3MMT8_SACI2|nr:hypothetical protein [Sulfolobus islandicus]ACP36805.1 conserved hypothetical protein [Sulfolobus islandicus L.S.2.15]ACP39414.1 conserved hypothetical protein [Sulfolobus islandicus M.14.25]ACP47104.1 conserved hypothetical protein [Sulfolobus islandicus Y.G.57.14]ACP56596.1 conserved hypothetical protein [Sulfolobus islandicus M.16.27]ACR43282.1 conserved hypothetical protein [Sulfolobus islandicus M.16.4]